MLNAKADHGNLHWANTSLHSKTVKSLSSNFIKGKHPSAPTNSKKLSNKIRRKTKDNNFLNYEIHSSKI
jgi:hypothetical protein